LLLLGVTTLSNGCASQTGWRLPWSREPASPISTSDDLTKYEHPAAAQEKISPLKALAATLPFSKSASQMNLDAAKKTKTIQPNDPLSLQNMPALGPEIYTKAAKLFEIKNNLPRAASNYEQALAIAPTDEEALVGYARMRDKEGKFKEAIELYSRAVEAHPQNASIHNDLAICLNRQGQVQSSLEEVQHAIQLEPQNPLYRNNIAKILVQAGRDEEALQQLTAVLPAPAAHYNLGYLLYENGRPDLAHSHFAQAIQLEPRFAQAAKMLELVQNGGAPIGPPAGPGPAGLAPAATPPVARELSAPHTAQPTGPSLMQPQVGSNVQRGFNRFSQLPALPRVQAPTQQAYGEDMSDLAPPTVEMPR
jgi:tetratricopeptide (TPR) repeat protein